MDSINSILGSKDLIEPDEIKKLKEYIYKNYGSQVEIRLTPKSIIITVDSSALANTLRLAMPRIKRQLAINDRLQLIIG